MIKNQTEELTHQTISYYNDYGLHVAGEINNLTAFTLTQSIEKKYPVDTITLSDGTRIWNLIRIYIYSNLPESLKQDENTTPRLSAFHLLKENITPLSVPKIPTPVCGFSGGASRKYYKDAFYDIYLDPFSEIFGDRFVLFEWPESRGYHRDYAGKIYTKHYVPFHIPVYTAAFWELLFYKLTSHKGFKIDNEDVLKEIIEFISTACSIDKKRITKDIYDFLAVFFSLKKLFNALLKKMSPKAVLIRCGYGRFPMALAQACREQHIPSIEVQHGIITTSHAAYIRTRPSDNYDCVPEYLLTYGDIFTDMVKKGNLFDTEKVISAGFPYLENNRNEQNRDTAALKTLLSSFHHTVFFTSQAFIAKEVKEFIIKVAKELEKTHPHIGIAFKPHPYDTTNYADLQNYQNIRLIDKYEDIFKLFTVIDIHATVYSTSGLEAMAFGKPNIFVDISGIMNISDSPFIVTSPHQFVASVDTILSNYKEYAAQTSAAAHQFFKPSSEKNFREVFTHLGLL
jgi:hypothetical protein